ncbi:phage baseplate assembly protein domain-containing protein [Escherichia coli]|uniref:phage baseplate assembly protein domain-containing protein n=1 Tax=Escherichia coli TaxID=562 RepID=UPI002FCD3FCF
MNGFSLRNLISRAVITAVDSARKCQSVGLKMIAGDQKQHVEHLEPYGFTLSHRTVLRALLYSRRAIVSHGVVVVVADRRYRLKGLKRGEVALYDDQGQSVVLTRSGIVVNGAGSPLFFKTRLKRALKCLSNPPLILLTIATVADSACSKCGRPTMPTNTPKMVMVVGSLTRQINRWAENHDD